MMVPSVHMYAHRLYIFASRNTRHVTHCNKSPCHVLPLRSYRSVVNAAATARVSAIPPLTSSHQRPARATV